jgi:hypothetical protein
MGSGKYLSTRAVAFNFVAFCISELHRSREIAGKEKLLLIGCSSRASASPAHVLALV